MKPIALEQIQKAVGHRPSQPLPAGLPKVSAVCTDSRKMEGNSLFIALRGETHDGHDHLADAAAGGAIAALVEKLPATPLPTMHMIVVPDSRVAMGKLARFVRQQMVAKVIGVGGSNGKTGTKHLIHAALSSKRGTISPKSFNNDIGVPLSIFPADPTQDYLVLEMGTNHPGEMKVLTEIARPDIAVITNCSAEHLEGLGDLMGVRREEASIIEGLNPNGLLVVNGDDPELLDAVANYKGKKITFGFKPGNDLFATEIRCGWDGVRFRLNNGRREVYIPLLGKHVACNALAAIAVARKMGLSEEMILDGLAEAKGPEMRLQKQMVNGINLLNDAYNANPGSMEAALQTVAMLEVPGRKIAVLGDMRELGETTERYHRQVGQMAAQARLDALVCVGENAMLIADAAELNGMSRASIIRCKDAEHAAKMIPPWLHEGDLVLLKASRSMHLEVVAKAIEQPKLKRKLAS